MCNRKTNIQKFQVTKFARVCMLSHFIQITIIECVYTKTQLLSIPCLFVIWIGKSMSVCCFEEFDQFCFLLVFFVFFSVSFNHFSFFMPKKNGKAYFNHNFPMLVMCKQFYSRFSVTAWNFWIHWIE